MFVCKSKSLANFLIENGCNVKKIDFDNMSNKHLVFLFDRNDDLNLALLKWSKICKRGVTNEFKDNTGAK